AALRVELERIDARPCPRVGIEAVDAERAQVLRAGRCLVHVTVGIDGCVAEVGHELRISKCGLSVEWSARRSSAFRGAPGGSRTSPCPGPRPSTACASAS